MNILIDRLPTSVIIGERKYGLNTDFRTSILFELLMMDDEVSEEEKLIKALELYYFECPPSNYLEEAINKMIWFYKCGKDDGIKSHGGSGGSRSPIFSFEHDDKYIYSAFLDQYGIDLQDVEDLHWWKFKAMFEGLKEDNLIIKIIGYRAMDTSKLPKDQKEHYNRLKKLYALPRPKSDRKKLDEITKALMGQGDLSVLKHLK